MTQRPVETNRRKTHEFLYNIVHFVANEGEKKKKKKRERRRRQTIYCEMSMITILTIITLPNTGRSSPRNRYAD